MARHTPRSVPSPASGAVGPVGPTRRQALCGLAIALVAPGALAACGSTETTTPDGSSGTTGGPAGTVSGTATPGTLLVALAELPVGGGTLVQAPDGRRILLVRLSENEVRAFDPTCPHQGSTVSPPSGGVITCPTHGSQFDAASGELRRGPATRGLTEIPVRAEGGQVVLA